MLCPEGCDALVNRNPRKPSHTISTGFKQSDRHSCSASNVPPIPQFSVLVLPALLPYTCYYKHWRESVSWQVRTILRKSNEENWTNEGDSGALYLRASSPIYQSVYVRPVGRLTLCFGIWIILNFLVYPFVARIIILPTCGEWCHDILNHPGTIRII